MSSPTFVRLQIGRQLRELREAAGINTEEAGRELDCSPSTVNRIELGKVGIKLPALEKILGKYGADAAQIETLLSMAKLGRQRGWWARYKDLPETYARYIGLESDARVIRDYEALVVPGLLQTEGYTRALFEFSVPGVSAANVEERVRVRGERQECLTGEDPPSLWVVIDESVLLRQIGGREVMQGQLERLREASQQRNITIQVLPFDGGMYAGTAGSFALLEFSKPGAPEIAYVEGLGGDLYSEGAEVGRYSLVFDNLRAAALSPEASSERIGRALAELLHE